MEHECLKQDNFNAIRKDIENLYAIKDVVVELKVLVTMQQEASKKQDEMLRQHSETLTNINNSTKQQSEMLKKLSEKYDMLDDKFVQKNIDELRENSISFSSLIRTFIDKALPPIIVAGLTYIILELVKKG